MNIPKTFPDLSALWYALEYAERSGHKAEAEHLKRLHAVSTAFGGGYGTHLPLLASVIAAAPPGPVLELGVGNFSTPVVAEMCRTMGRKHMALEKDAPWLAMMADHIALERRYALGDKGNWVEMIASFTKVASGDQRWAVAFVDHGPGYDRLEALAYLRKHADLIVVHDTHNSFFTGVDDELATFKYRYDYTRLCPTTTVVSDTCNLPQRLGDAGDGENGEEKSQ